MALPPIYVILQDNRCHILDRSANDSEMSCGPIRILSTFSVTNNTFKELVGVIYLTYANHFEWPFNMNEFQ